MLDTAIWVTDKHSRKVIWAPQTRHENNMTERGLRVHIQTDLTLTFTICCLLTVSDASLHPATDSH